MTFADVTVKHVPTAFKGVKAKGPPPDVDVRLKVWEFVTLPPKE